MDYFSLIMLLFFCGMIWYARSTGKKYIKMFGEPKKTTSNDFDEEIYSFTYRHLPHNIHNDD